MSAQENKPTTKKFGKGERSVPHHSQKASKWYPAHIDPAAKKVRALRAVERATEDVLVEAAGKALPHTFPIRRVITDIGFTRPASRSAQRSTASRCSPAPSSSSSLVVSAASASSFSSSCPRALCWLLVPSRSTVFLFAE